MKLDVRGEICPYPQVKTVAALKKLAPSDQLEVLTDHPPALETVAAQAARLCRRDRGSRHRGMVHCAAQKLRRKALLMVKSST
jgi:hypothetical protein